MRWRKHLTAAGVAALAVGVVGCGATSHDDPAFSGAPSGVAATVAPTTTPSGGPGISQSSIGGVATPHVTTGTGAGAINRALTAIAARLAAGGRACSVTTTRSDRSLVSWRWSCSDRSVATATFAVPTGRPLVLADVLRGQYLAYLSTTAITQLQAGGVSPAAAASLAGPTTAAFSRWGLTPTALVVTFPVASGPVMITYPLTTLGTFLVPGGPLS